MFAILRAGTPRLWRALRVALPFAALGALFILFPNVTADTLALVLGGALVAILTEPLASAYERRLNRSAAALLAILTCVGGALLLMWLLLPSLVSEFIELTKALPASIEIVKGWMGAAANWIEGHLPGIRLPEPKMDGAQLPALAKGTIDFAGGVADLFYRLSLMFVLGYFFLCDRSRLLIRLELLVPKSMRKTAVRMGNAVCRELKLYLRGQGMIAAAVGALAAVGLALAGVRSALVLGIIVGILNMVPYFGPVIGGVPAVLAALSGGLNTALLAVFVLWLVQQIDGAWISPRIMGSLAGVSPATVLVAIFVGSALGGIVGMLFAMPAVMAFRTVFRVFVQRYENV